MTRYPARYTPRFIAAVKRRYEDTDEPMPTIAFTYDISLRTLHRMVDREGWRKRGDRPPKDLTSTGLVAEAAEALTRGDTATANALMEQSKALHALEREALRRQGLLPPDFP
jgi:hypothetical protein